MQVKVPSLAAQQATLQRIDVGTLSVGPLQVGSLTIDNTDFAMNAAQAILRNISVTLGLHLELEWSIDLEVFSDSGTEDLGTPQFTLPAPDLTVAPLNNIRINIPNLVAQNATAQADSLAVSLTNAVADGVGATNTSLPTAGFTIAGLSLTSVEGDNVAVPAAGVQAAAVNHVRADPLRISSFTVRNLALPSAQSASIVNTAPLVMPLALGELRPRPGIDLGFLKVVLHITPRVSTTVGSLEIRSVTASATVSQVVLRDVVVPFDVLNLTLGQIGINSVAVPAFAVS